MKKRVITSDQGLAATMAEALRLYAKMRADGVPKQECVDYLEAVLRKCWPNTREWHYLCDSCRDTGWIPRSCTPETPCGRPFKLPPSTNRSGYQDFTGQGRCTPGHDYVVPCFCPRGVPHQRALSGRQDDPVDDAGARVTRRKWSRVGR